MKTEWMREEAALAEGWAVCENTNAALAGAALCFVGRCRSMGSGCRSIGVKVPFDLVERYWERRSVVFCHVEDGAPCLLFVCKVEGGVRLKCLVVNMCGVGTGEELAADAA